MSQKNLIYFIVIICFIISEKIQAQIVINEVMSRNNTTLADEDGDYSDWIELYNKGTETINLLGYTLSDNGNEWSFPNIELIGNSFIVIFASNKDKFTTELHTNFSLKSDGESLLLYDNNQNLLDEIESTLIEGDHSFGRTTDGNEMWTHFFTSTPNMPNNEGIKQAPITFSHTVGIYNEPFLLSLESEANTEIRYTTDGSIPTINEEVYTTSINITDRANDPNYYCLIQSTPTPYEPVGNIDKINVIRARSFRNGVISSVVYTKTYIVETATAKQNVPIVSIVSEPNNLFDDTIGIYVTGASFNPSTGLPNGNYWYSGAAWERPMHFEFLDTTGLLFAQNAGIRLHGGDSRQHRTKGFRLYAREEYGANEFDYPFFADRDFSKYKRLVLRRGTGINWSFFTDELTTNLIAETSVGRMASKQVRFFINGEYWGLYHLRERIDKHFLAQHYDVNKDSIDFIKNDPNTCCLEGSNTHYLDILDFLENNNISIPENYTYLQSQINIDDFIEYSVLRLYCADTDWPHNNIRHWRPQTEDGKWRWIIFDTDFAFNYRNRDSFGYYIDSLDVPIWTTYLGRTLLKNEEFKNQFLDRFEYHLNYTFKKERVAHYIDSLSTLVEPHVQEYIDRFDLPLTKDEWENNVMEMKTDFASFRPCELQNQLLGELEEMITIETCVVYEEPKDTTIVFLSDKFMKEWSISISHQNLKISCSNCLVQETDLKIYDLTGKVVWEQKIESTHNTIHLSFLPKAIYICKVWNKNQEYTQKIFWK